jgi:transposase-like protein
MRTRFNQSFKIQAVEKALSRSRATTLKEVADSLGVGQSTLNKWVVKSRNHEYEPVTDTEISSLSLMTTEKRPQDWSLEEKLNLIIACGLLDDDAVNALCRERGVYPHHVKQWKQDFVGGAKADTKANVRSEAKILKSENKALKKELNRKDRALAETAALLVLQKKVNAIWGSDEDNSQ